MNQPRKMAAGAAFARMLENDPAGRAALERVQKRLRLFGQGLSATPSICEGVEELAVVELGIALREALRIADCDLSEAGFEAPRTIEDLEHLARIVGLPFDTIRSGDFTAYDVYVMARAWIDRQRIKANLATRTVASEGTVGVGSSVASGDESTRPALKSSELNVMRTLAAFDPSELASAARIAGKMKPMERLSTRSIGVILRRLVDLDLVERPQGKRSGVRLTPSGRRVVRKIAD